MWQFYNKFNGYHCSNNYNSQSSKRVCFNIAFWKCLLIISVLMQIIADCGCGAGAFTSVYLAIEPKAVRRGQQATLRCMYVLDGSAALYNVKFYRGLREIYRFSPNESPPQKVLPFPGINIDTALSVGNKVVIKNIGFGLAGNYSCEVTSEGPPFSTATANTQLQVVELPETPPILFTEQTQYEPGDVLKANCTSPPSRPKVDLTITLNNIVLYNLERNFQQTTEGLMSSRVSLRVQLQSSHFGNSLTSNNAGQLVLRCSARIGSIYQEFVEKELGVTQRDPIPAKVTSSGSNHSSASTTTILASLAALLLLSYSSPAASSCCAYNTNQLL